MAIQSKVSLPVIKRLPKYYRYLTTLSADGKEKISSSELAHMMGTTASQVRQDFNCFGGFGQQGIGYKVDVLRAEIGKLLFSDGEKLPTILIGQNSRVPVSPVPAHRPAFSCCKIPLRASDRRDPADGT